MNWDQMEGKWKQASGKVKENWGKLTDSDLEIIRGRRDQLIGKIQERYGVMKEEAQKQADEFTRTLVLVGEEPSTQAHAEDEESAENHVASRHDQKSRGAGR